MKSILIVDDKPEIAKIIMIYLSSSYQVVYMENPVKAISWMNEGNIPDGIISDLNMPEMSGEEFVCYQSHPNFSIIERRKQFNTNTPTGRRS